MAARVGTLWQVCVEVDERAEEAVAELLSSIFDAPSSSYSALPDRIARVSVYIRAIGERKKQLLKAGLEMVSAELLVTTKVNIRRIRRENWAESWKRHFKPLEISSRLLVVPSWSKRRRKPGQARVIIDPGLSFGTGQHPTTAFCLSQVAALRKADCAQAFLDVGCGSGILSIAAAKLGYKPVEAFDFDPDAVRVARANAESNDVKIKITQRDLTKSGGGSRQSYEVVCANLTYDLLLSQRDKLLALVAPEGTLVLAGILVSQFAAVDKAFKAAGLKRGAEEATPEWRSAAYRRKELR